MKTNILLIFLFLSIFIPMQLLAHKEKIVVWNYYLASPFFISQKSGLAYDFVALLNEEFEDRYDFKLQHIPRARLNKYLSSNNQGLVLFVNWLWMGKDSKHNYLWSEKILDDKNIVISHINKRLNFEDIKAQNNLVFGAIRGRKYKPFDKFFKDNTLHRYDVTSEKQVLNMIVQNRVDITTQPFTIASSLSNSLNIRNKLFFSPESLFSFSRYIMITPKLDELKDPLNGFLKELDNNTTWQEILKKYNLITEG